MKTYKIADIVENEILLTERGKYRSLNIGAILTNLRKVENPHPDFSLEVRSPNWKGIICQRNEVRVALPHQHN